MDRELELLFSVCARGMGFTLSSALFFVLFILEFGSERVHRNIFPGLGGSTHTGSLSSKDSKGMQSFEAGNFG